MKKLLLLALVAVARDATAEDTKCIRERATMIETIRAYARDSAKPLQQRCWKRARMTDGDFSGPSGY